MNLKRIKMSVIYASYSKSHLCTLNDSAYRLTSNFSKKKKPHS